MNLVILLLVTVIAIGEAVHYIYDDVSAASSYQMLDHQTGTKKLPLCRAGLIEALKIPTDLSLPERKEFVVTSYRINYDVSQCDINYYLMPAISALMRYRVKADKLTFLSVGLSYMRSCLYTEDACNGGDPFYALQVISQYGIPVKSEYEFIFENEPYEPTVCDKVSPYIFFPVKGWYKIDLPDFYTDQVGLVTRIKQELVAHGPVLACTDYQLIEKVDKNNVFRNDVSTCNTFIVISGWDIETDAWLVHYHRSSWGNYGAAKFSMVNNTFISSEVYAVAIDSYLPYYEIDLSLQ